MLQLITDTVDERTARGIAAAVGRLITAGDIAPGLRLPTVRAVARALHISPTTVSEAWRSLALAGAIQTRGRSGTFVLPPDRLRERLRYARLTASPATMPQDLSTGVPDYDLLPSLSAALRRIGDAQLTTTYLDDPVLPALEDILRAQWSYPVEHLTVVDGALDALDRIAAQVLRFGDHVLVENPAFPPLLDVLESVGATAVAVGMDSQGITPDALRSELLRQPAALFLQPRAQNPTGSSMTVERMNELAEILADYPDVLVVEDDHAGDIATGAAVSLGSRLAGRTIHIRSFSKSHGPDLRLAAVGGPAAIVTAISDRRMLGPGWSSRLLQAVLTDLLTDETTVAQVSAARAEYAARRTALVEALAHRGVAVSVGDGINLWLPVANQQRAILALAAHGVAVAPGAPFEVSSLGVDHIRVTVGLVRSGFSDLADVLAEAVNARAGGSGRRHNPFRTRGR